VNRDWIAHPSRFFKKNVTMHHSQTETQLISESCGGSGAFHAVLTIYLAQPEFVHEIEQFCGRCTWNSI
jgi:hypothetical protein